MENLKLNNGILMPVIGLGVFRMGESEETVNIIKEALAFGYRHIDTAAFYQNEEEVGIAVRESGIPREEIFITTKVWNDDQREGRVREAFEDSLKKLGTEYIDLYLIHWPVKEKFVETWKILEELYNTGKIKAIGVSNFKEHHLEDLKKVSDIIPAVNQVELHPYLIQEDILSYCKKEGIRLEAWSPFAANTTGLLHEKTLISLGEKYSKTPAQIILRWNYQRGVITIPKSANKDRLKENFSIFDFSLSDEDMRLINSLNKNERIGADPDTFDF